MISPPKLDYSGVTVILSHASRFDKEELISGTAGEWFDYCFRPLSRLTSELRTIDEKLPLRSGTNAVLLCGLNALNFLKLPEGTKLSNVRGTPYTREGITALATFHPQDAMDPKNYEEQLNKTLYVGDGDASDEDTDSDNESEGNSIASTKNKGATSRANYKFWLYQDCKKLATAAPVFQFPTNECYHEIYPPATRVVQWMDSLSGQRVYFDIETNPQTFELLCFSMGVSAEHVITVPIRQYNSSIAYDEYSIARIVRALCGVFKRNTIVGHNVVFDLFVLMWKWRIPPPPWDQIEDTMVMHHRNYLGIEKSLGHCISLYTNQPYHKDEGNFFPRNHAQDMSLWSYNAKDVEVLPLIHKGILQHGEKLGTLSAMKQGNEAIRWLMTIMYRGVSVDTEKLCKMIDRNDKFKEFFVGRVIPKLVGYNLNPQSADQVSDYLYNKLGLKRNLRSDHTKTGTGKKSLYSIQIKKDVPVVTAILAMRRLTTEQGKLKSLLWRGNRWTGGYNVAGPKSLRLSSNKLFGEWGTNMQNFKKGIKKLVIPDDGYELVQVDLSGVEAHIVAYLCRPGSTYRELFIHGIKPHTYIALRLFFKHFCDVFDRDLSHYLHLPISEIKSQKDWAEISKAIADTDEDIPSRRFYYFAKQTCHSANYGIGPYTFCMNVLDKSEGEVRLTLKEGTRFLNVYHSTFPEIRQDFHLLIRANLERDMTLTNLLGYPRRFWGIINNSMLKDAYSWIPQSTGSGCIAVIAGTQIQRKIEEGVIEPFFDILQNNHDSLMGQARIGRGAEMARILADHLNIELTSPYGEKFRLRSEPQVGTNWKDVIKITL